MSDTTGNLIEPKETNSSGEGSICKDKEEQTNELLQETIEKNRANAERLRKERIATNVDLSTRMRTRRTTKRK